MSSLFSCFGKKSKVKRGNKEPKDRKVSHLKFGFYCVNFTGCHKEDIPPSSADIDFPLCIYLSISSVNVYLNMRGTD
jgi:hypothetical protein